MQFLFKKFKSIWTEVPSDLPGDPLGDLPGDPPDYQMFPNLTDQFIKLSDGNLQCEWNSDILFRESLWSSL